VAQHAKAPRASSGGSFPALTDPVRVFAPGAVDTGLAVLAPYKQLDQGFSASLVFTFAPPEKG
jgi:hypothetical protein